MLEMISKFAVTSEKEIAEFEQGINSQLPSHYKSFLLEHNGGKPKRDIFSVLEEEDNIRYFFGIGTDNMYDLQKEHDLYKGRIPEWLLPIASDELGNLLCISINPPHEGQIYFWDHELEYNGNEAITLLANDFDEFVDSLREESDD